MRQAWKKIKRLIDSNATHQRKNFQIGEVRPPFIIGQAMEEFKELMEAPDDPQEMADLFGVLIHYCIKQGWTIELIEKLLSEKLDLRFKVEK